MYSPTDQVVSHTMVRNRRKKAVKASAQKPNISISIDEEKKVRTGPKRNARSVRRKNRAPRSSRGTRVPRATLEKHPVFGSAAFSSSSRTVPSAFVNMDFNGTFLRQGGNVKHPHLGLDGICLVGCQPLTNILPTSDSSSLFDTGSIATTQNNALDLTPNDLNGPIGAQAAFHNRYVFRDIVIEYVSTVASTQEGAMALGIVRSQKHVAATTFSKCRQIVPSITFPYRASRSYLHWHYDGPLVFLNDSNEHSWNDPDVTQATLYGFPASGSAGDDTVYGYTNIWYSVELYDPIPTAGFSVVAESIKERELLKAYLKKLREIEVPDEKSDPPKRKKGWFEIEK